MEMIAVMKDHQFSSIIHILTASHLEHSGGGLPGESPISIPGCAVRSAIMALMKMSSQLNSSSTLARISRG